MRKETVIHNTLPAACSPKTWSLPRNLDGFIGEGRWSFADFVVNTDHSPLALDAVKIVQSLPLSCTGNVWFDAQGEGNEEEARGYHSLLV